MRYALALAVAASACGDDGGGMVQPDAARQIDAATNKVVTVTCPSGTLPTVMTTDLNTTSYSPMATTIAVGGIVKFMMAPSHDVMPNTIGMSDPGLAVGFGATKCLQFTAAGTFGFFCSAHGFAGTVTVQ